MEARLRQVRSDMMFEKFERTSAAWLWEITNIRPYGRQVGMMEVESKIEE